MRRKLLRSANTSPVSLQKSIMTVTMSNPFRTGSNSSLCLVGLERPSISATRRIEPNCQSLLPNSTKLLMFRPDTNTFCALKCSGRAETHGTDGTGIQPRVSVAESSSVNASIIMTLSSLFIIASLIISPSPSTPLTRCSCQCYSCGTAVSIVQPL